MTLKEIQERRAQIAEEMNAAGADLDALMKEAQGLKDAEAELEKREALRAEVSRGAGAPVDMSQGADADPLNTLQYRRAFQALVATGEMKPELREAGPTKTGDVAIPTTLLDQIVGRLPEAGRILRLVTQTAYKGGVAIPKGQVRPVATWVAEGAGSERQKLGTGQVVFGYHKLRVAVSMTLEVSVMSLSAFEAMFVRGVVDAMQKALDIAILNGTGSGQPKGILLETAPEGQALEVNALDLNMLYSAEAALPEEYEAGAKWCMSKATFVQILGMVDKNGQPVARVTQGLEGGLERVLLGREVVVTPELKNFTKAESGDVVAFLVDFKDYVLNTNYAITVKRYEDNETDDIVTKAVTLVDGQLVDNGSLVTVKKK